MGIRFFCPNGHKLNVKSFLAGKRAYCPKCGTKLLIPQTSAASLAPPGGAEKNQAADLLPRPSQRRDSPAAGEPNRGSQEEDPQEPDSPSVHVSSPAEVDPATTNLPQPQSSSDGVSLSDEFLWYVRPPSGGQYGPATRAEIDRWNKEGRIPVDSLVWREGWEDWRSAAESLQDDSVAEASRQDDRALDLSATPKTNPAGGDDRWSYQAAKKKKKATAVVLLSVACLILMVIFFIVVRPGNS